MTIWLGIVYAYKGLLMVGARQAVEMGSLLCWASFFLGALINIEINRAPMTKHFLSARVFPSYAFSGPTTIL